MNNLYMRADTGEVITKEKRDAIMYLIKIMYKLNIINVDQALYIAMQFKILFV